MPSPDDVLTVAHGRLNREPWEPREFRASGDGAGDGERDDVAAAPADAVELKCQELWSLATRHERGASISRGARHAPLEATERVVCTAATRPRC